MPGQERLRSVFGQQGEDFLPVDSEFCSSHPLYLGEGVDTARFCYRERPQRGVMENCVGGFAGGLGALGPPGYELLKECHIFGVVSGEFFRSGPRAPPVTGGPRGFFLF